MRKRAMLTVLTALAMVVTACGGGVPEAAAPNDTIAVHGDWTIDIYNPDGTLDEHVEFENAFEGEAPLSSLLAGGYEVNAWMLRFRSSVDSPCDETGQLPCIITNDVGMQGDHVSQDLAVAIESGTIVLSGSTTAEADASISVVESVIDLAPTNGAFDTLFQQFTMTETGPHAVTAGQTVQVEVVISFTTG